MKPLVVLWFGGGQDSTALLYKFVLDRDFRNTYCPNDAHFVVIMSDTGNEYPNTYKHVWAISSFCRIHKIEFYFINPEMGYHGRTWQSLQGQMNLNSSVMSVAFPKSCTDNLKIKVCYRFLADYLRELYGFDGKEKKVYYQYYQHFGKLISIIGFAKGEESRMAEPAQLEIFPKEGKKDPRPVWMQKTVQHRYPLVEMRWDRADCQHYIKSLGFDVPMPSNCKWCPFQSEAEIVYLFRFHPEDWQLWKEAEKAKLLKNEGRERNLGVKGEKTLDEFLEIALTKYGSWTDEQLIDYRFSHGHCVKSKY